MVALENRREACEGCGRPTRLGELTVVTLPGGETVAVCPDCRSHARAAAERAGEQCDGCADVVPAADVEEVRLPDGAVVVLCPDCREAVPDRAADGRSDDATERCSQCREPSADVAPVTVADGRTERLCPACLEAAREEGIVASVGMRASRAREVLGVDGDATDEEIRRAFLDEVKTVHPDRPTGSRSEFERVVEAYERLS